MNILQIRPAHAPVRAATILVFAGFTLAACSTGTASTPNQTSSRSAGGGAGAAGAGAEAGGGGAAPAAGGEAGGGGGEAPALRYQNARFHYRIDAPGTMQEAADGSASTRRGEERLSVNVVTGSSAADLRAYATADLKQVQAASPKFHQVQALTSVKIAGRASLKVIYSWTDGTNPVTGRPEDLVTARYYIPRDGTTAAVVAYSIASSQYDPQGADDVASTFTWL
ncbi:MAG: hypothetical protein NVSMB17_00180 [Candidatus Dormibacteria bacterium]